MWAVQNSNVKVVKLLLKHGADPNLNSEIGTLESFYLKKAVRAEEVRAALRAGPGAAVGGDH